MPIKVTPIKGGKYDKADAQDKMEKIGKAKEKTKLKPIGAQPANKVEKVEGMMTGGMCRGMGAAIKGGKFGGVK